MPLAFCVRDNIHTWNMDTFITSFNPLGVTFHTCCYVSIQVNLGHDIGNRHHSAYTHVPLGTVITN